jgi:hypothetical protein
MDGGLGSQMWQYALGRAAGMRSPLPVYYDLSWFARDGMDINGIQSRAYRLEDVFPAVRVRRAESAATDLYRKYFDLYPGTRFDYGENILASDSPRYLGGYYLNARYIDEQGDALRDEFEFNVPLSGKNMEILSVIEESHDSVALHVRRGDYVGSIHDVTTSEYFREAVKTVSARLSPARAVFFVFSNGMDWSRETLKGIDENFVFVENNDNDRGEADMFLMSKCCHFIISNSSFSWWPAWLSRRSIEKIVIAPDVWLNRERTAEKHGMLLKDWLILPGKMQKC